MENIQIYRREDEP